MIYCPHCRKPSARKDGPCPHCGGDLTAPAGSAPDGARKTGPKIASQAAPPPATEPPVQPSKTAPTPVAESRATGGADAGAEFVPPGPVESGLEIESTAYEAVADVPHTPMVDPSMQEGGGVPSVASGLSLDSLEPPPPVSMEPAAVPLLKQREADEMAVDDLARFGAPDASLVGSVKYWLRVRTRLKELVAEHAAAIDEHEAAKQRKTKHCAALGRRAHQIGLDGEQLTQLISQATLAEGELRGTERRHSSLADEHESKVAPLTVKKKEIETEAAPMRQKERQTRAELDKLVTDRKRIEAKLKRAEIELRNIDEIIKKRQEEYADLERPKEERNKLLADISTFDNKRPALVEQVKELEGEMSKLDAPIVKVEDQLDEIQQIVGEKQKRIDAIQAELNNLERNYSQARGEVAQQVESESEKAESAWTAVGEHVIAGKLDEPELKELKLTAIGAVTAESETARKVELLTLAQEAYNHDVVKKAQIIVGAAAGGIVVLIILLAVLAA